MKPHIIQLTTTINRPVAEVFDFFCKAENLNLLTPPAIGFKIKTPLPIDMKRGTLIDYSIKVDGIPLNWRTEITVWEPPYSFVDVQLKGPYAMWEHEHLFRSISNDQTEMTDTVKYLSPGWLMEPVIHYLYTQRKVAGIFKYREQQLKEIFK